MFSIKYNFKKHLDKKGFKVFSLIERNETLREYYYLAGKKLNEKTSQVEHDFNHAQRTALISRKLVEEFASLQISYEQVEQGLCTEKETNLTIFVAALLHDVGNAIARHNHAQNGAFLVKEVVGPILKKYYPKKHVLLETMVLSHIMRHQFEGPLKPKDLAATIVALSDKLDVTHHRAEVGARDFINLVTNSVLEINLETKNGKLVVKIKIKNIIGTYRVRKIIGTVKKLPPKYSRIIEIRSNLVH